MWFIGKWFATRFECNYDFILVFYIIRFLCFKTIYVIIITLLLGNDSETKLFSDYNKLIGFVWWHYNVSSSKKVVCLTPTHPPDPFNSLLLLLLLLIPLLPFIPSHSPPSSLLYCPLQCSHVVLQSHFIILHKYNKFSDTCHTLSWWSIID